MGFSEALNRSVQQAAESVSKAPETPKTFLGRARLVFDDAKLTDAQREEKLREETKNLTPEQAKGLEKDLEDKAVRKPELFSAKELAMLTRVTGERLAELRKQTEQLLPSKEEVKTRLDDAKEKLGKEATHAKKDLGEVYEELKKGDWKSWVIYGGAVVLAGAAAKWLWDHTGGWVISKFRGGKKSKFMQGMAVVGGGLLGLIGLQRLLRHPIGGAPGLSGGPEGNADTGKEGKPDATKKAEGTAKEKPEPMDKPKKSEKLPEPRVVGETPETKESKDPEDVRVKNIETADKKAALWTLPIETLTPATFRADASREQQRWYRNVKTGQTYSLDELKQRLEELKVKYPKSYPDVKELFVCLEFKTHGQTPAYVCHDLKGLRRSVNGLYSLEEGTPEKEPNAPSKVSLNEDAIVIDSARTYYTPAAFDATYAREKKDGLWSDKKEFAAARRTIDQMPPLGPCEVDYVIGQKAALPLLELTKRMYAPEKSLIRLRANVRVLGLGTEPPANGKACLLMSGRETPVTPDELLKELNSLKSQCGRVPAVVNVQFERAEGSAAAQDYQSALDQLRNQGDELFLNDLPKAKPVEKAPQRDVQPELEKEKMQDATTQGQRADASGDGLPSKPGDVADVTAEG